MDPIVTFAEALEKQTQVMAEALSKKTKRSTIQVSPKVSWPMLDDECSDYRSVQEFYDTFEATIGLAMTAKACPTWRNLPLSYHAGSNTA